MSIYHCLYTISYLCWYLCFNQSEIQAKGIFYHQLQGGGACQPDRRGTLSHNRPFAGRNRPGRRSSRSGRSCRKPDRSFRGRRSWRCSWCCRRRDHFRQRRWSSRRASSLEEQEITFSPSCCCCSCCCCCCVRMSQRKTEKKCSLQMKKQLRRSLSSSLACYLTNSGFTESKQLLVWSKWLFAALCGHLLFN